MSQERKRHINITILSGDCLGEGGGSPDQVPKGQMFMCCVRNPSNTGIRLGGSVTGSTEILLMCQMFMCLVWPILKFGQVCLIGKGEWPLGRRQAPRIGVFEGRLIPEGTPNVLHGILLQSNKVLKIRAR